MGGPMDYWLVHTVPSDTEGRPTEPGVNGGLMRRMMPIWQHDPAAAAAEPVGQYA